MLPTHRRGGFHIHSCSLHLPSRHTSLHMHTLHYLQASPFIHALLQTYTHILVYRHSCLFAHRWRHPYACAHTLTLLFHTPCNLHTHPKHAASDAHLRIVCCTCPCKCTFSVHQHTLTPLTGTYASVYPLNPSPLPCSCKGCICIVSQA